MRIQPEQIKQQLKKPLLPVYFVCGDEPLQKIEVIDAIRAAAREQAFTNRELLIADKSFDWAQLAFVSSNMSLFGDKTLVELRIEGSGPGRDGGQALQQYLQQAPADTVLLAHMGKIDSRSQQAKWFKAVEQAGAVVQVWPVKPAALPGWVQQRLQARGLQLDLEAAQLLAMRVEGNLLAAAQEVDKLVLLYGQAGSRLGVREVSAAVSDSARYNVYDLVDAATAGSTKRALRILKGLRQEGAATPLLLWALANEIRTLRSMSVRLAAGEPEQRLLAQVWQNRRPIVAAALRRIKPETWGILVQYCAEADALSKGARRGNEWDAFQRIVFTLASGSVLLKKRAVA